MLSPKGNYDITYTPFDTAYAHEWEVRVRDRETGRGSVAYCDLSSPYLRAALVAAMIPASEHDTVDTPKR